MLNKLQKYFGYTTFRHLQKEVIDNVLDGKDTIAIMPTGGGKSICYQLPSLIFEGMTLVISPLIALMKDQVQSLHANGIEAAFLNSSLSANEELLIKRKIDSNKVNLLYVSPERVFSKNFISYLKTLKISLFAIDEAHCVSSWGHHFRPEYQKLHILKKEFSEIPFIALTATADRAVRSDMGELLGMYKPKSFIASFDRPNLSLAVLPGQKKWEQLLQVVKKFHGKSGIIYCSSRKATETLSEKLQKNKVKAACYHAGLSSDIRNETQDGFIQGEINVICATIAFGMGIDKSDVRFVIHYNMPGNIESYYQEIGRAGRDGLPAETILFYSYRDVQTQIGFIEDITHIEYKEIQLAKLKRMQEYAEAQICRRKILLSYFSETLQEDCGNCDVCKNPPKFFDGTIHAQKALSAIVRTKEKIGITTLIDILKGSHSEAVKENAYNQIKTFGLGKDTTNFAWQLYVQQFIQQGILELDYKDHYNLKLNSLSDQVLKGESKVKLIDYEVVRRRQEEQKKSVVKIPKAEITANESLFEHLRLLRKNIAAKIGKPVFVVFSNESLKDMSAVAPSNIEEFLNVHGVGEYKAKKFGDVFLKAIAEFESGKSKGNTFEITLSLFRQGKSVAEIAKERGIQVTTVYSHIAHLMSKNEDIDVFNFISKRELAEVKKAADSIGLEYNLKSYFDFLNGKIEYGKIRIAIAYLSQKKQG